MIYVKLVQNLINEINNDIELNVKFWKFFQQFKEKNKTLDYNNVFLQ